MTRAVALAALALLGGCDAPTPRPSPAVDAGSAGAAAPVVDAGKSWVLTLKSSDGGVAPGGRAEFERGGAAPCDVAKPVVESGGATIRFGAGGQLKVPMPEDSDRAFLRLVADDGELGFPMLMVDQATAEVVLGTMVSPSLELRCGEAECAQYRFRAASLIGGGQRCEVLRAQGEGRPRLGPVPTRRTLYVYAHGNLGTPTESDGMTTFEPKGDETLVAKLKVVGGKEKLAGEVTAPAGLKLTAWQGRLEVDVECDGELVRSVPVDAPSGKWSAAELPRADCTAEVLHVPVEGERFPLPLRGAKGSELSKKVKPGSGGAVVLRLDREPSR